MVWIFLVDFGIEVEDGLIIDLVWCWDDMLCIGCVLFGFWKIVCEVFGKCVEMYC